MSDNLLKEFEECKTLTDVYNVARRLRASNTVSSQEINALVTQAKKMIVSRSSDYRRIEKYAIPVVPINENPISQFVLNITQIYEPVITIKPDGTVVL